MKYFWIVGIMLIFLMPNDSYSQKIHADTLNFSMGHAARDSVLYSSPFYAFTMIARSNNAWIRVSTTGTIGIDTTWMQLTKDAPISFSETVNQNPVIRKIWFFGVAAGYLEIWGLGKKTITNGR